MLKEVSIVSGEIHIEGDLSPQEKETINCICNRWQNLCEFGLPHHRKKRKQLSEMGVVFTEWTKCPKIRIVYTYPQHKGDFLIIRATPSNTTLDKTLSTEEKTKQLEKAKELWIEEVAKAIREEFNITIT